MCAIPDTLIDLSVLKEDESEYAFRFTDSMLEAMPPSPVAHADVAVGAILRRTGSHYILNMHLSGAVELQCSRCLQPLTHEVDSTYSTEIRIGEQKDEDEHLLIVEQDNPIADLAWMAYEQLVLTLPIQPLHAHGECSGEVIDRLRSMSTEESRTAQTADIDPRWQQLMQLTEGQEN